MDDYKELIGELRDFSKQIELDNKRYDIPYGIYHEETLDKAADAIEQLVKERDAAVADLKTVAHRHNLCDCCKHCTVPNGDDCDYGDDCEWEWRGVEEK